MSLLDWMFGSEPPDHLPPGSGPRSPHWPSVRKAHLLLEPRCQVCGAGQGLNVHHVRPFHLFPQLELEQTNLITLCEGKDGGCHIRWGHLWNWSAWNPSVREDCVVWVAKILARKLTSGGGGLIK